MSSLHLLKLSSGMILRKALDLYYCASVMSSQVRRFLMTRFYYTDDANKKKVWSAMDPDHKKLTWKLTFGCKQWIYSANRLNNIYINIFSDRSFSYLFQSHHFYSDNFSSVLPNLGISQLILSISIFNWKQLKFWRLLNY